jgi:16S rRNA (adenine1518-N6/adenine1519-N6)-dimethyltransferase
MDLLKKTQELCRLYEIKPARSKGQNFLIKDDIYEQIIDASDLHAEDVVLEVGPGLGFLTSRLAKKVKKVIAVELDDKLAKVLQIGLDSQGVMNVEVVNRNILDLKWPLINSTSPRPSSLGGARDRLWPGEGVTAYKIVANLPYNISSVFLRKFLSAEEKPELMVLMLQKEVAERICARPGKMSLLAVSVQFYAEPMIVKKVDANCFWPEPAVGSAIIKLQVESPASPAGRRKSKVDEREFFRLVKIGFSARRKMLKNNLAAGYKMDQKIIAVNIKKAGLSENCRPQELSVDDWLKLFGYFG